MIQIRLMTMQVDFDPKRAFYRWLGAPKGACYRKPNSAPHKVQRSSIFSGLWLNDAAFWPSDTAAGFGVRRAYGFCSNPAVKHRG